MAFYLLHNYMDFIFYFKIKKEPRQKINLLSFVLANIYIKGLIKNALMIAIIPRTMAIFPNHSASLLRAIKPKMIPPLPKRIGIVNKAIKDIIKDSQPTKLVA